MKNNLKKKNNNRKKPQKTKLQRTNYSCESFWKLAAHHKTGIEMLEHVQRRATELGEGVEHTADEEQLKV